MTEHEQYLENIRLEHERQVVQIKAGTIAKWKPTFEKAGFYDYGIDFSDVCAGAIHAMGEALEDFFAKVAEFERHK